MTGIASVGLTQKLHVIYIEKHKLGYKEIKKVRGNP